jgi:hypothetical protein
MGVQPFCHKIAGHPKLLSEKVISVDEERSAIIVYKNEWLS